MSLDATRSRTQCRIRTRNPFSLGRTLTAALGLTALLGSVGISAAHAQTFYTDRTAFNADPGAAGTTTIDFDGFATGTDLTGSTLSGATFTAPGSSPLTVIAGATGVRFPDSPSSGANILSPGGSDPNLQNDDLDITFATPVQAAGLDVVFDVPDGASFVGVTFFDSLNNVLFSNGFIPAPSGAPGFQFVGFVSNSANIKRVSFDEFDDTAFDDNVAYDTVTFSNITPSSSAAPEPGSAALLLSGMATLTGIALRNRRRAA